MANCSFNECLNAVYVKGLCSGHYTQKRRGGPLKPIVIRSNSSLLPCSFNGCVNKQQAKGLCGAHWRQQHVGKKLSKLRNQESIMERILSQVNKTDDCWNWEGRVSGLRKYPQISLSGTQTMVHRIVFEESVRHLNPGETLDHLCRNRLCVNPDHLEAVTLGENVKRMHAWRSIEKENKRLVDFVESLGYDSKTLLKKEE